MDFRRQIFSKIFKSAGSQQNDDFFILIKLLVSMLSMMESLTVMCLATPLFLVLVDSVVVAVNHMSMASNHK
jgi:hypothetical protein